MGLKLGLYKNIALVLNLWLLVFLLKSRKNIMTP